jgi:MFS family permease
MADAHTYRTLLRLPGMRPLLVAACLSRLASGMFTLVVVLYVLDRFHSPALAGWVAFAAVAPGLLVSPLAGALLDRLGAAPAMAVDMAASATMLLLLAVADIAGAVTGPLLLTFVALYSLTRPLTTAGIRVLIPQLVPAQALDLANALDTTSYALINIAGPAAAGVLFALAGPQASLVAIVVFYAAATMGLVPLVRLPRPKRTAGSTSLLTEAAHGVIYLLRHRSLRNLAVSYALYQVSWGILVVTVPVAIIRDLGAGARADAVTGALWAVAAFAGGVGALCAGHLRTDGREKRVLALCMLATAVALYPIGPAFGLVSLAAALLLAGLLEGPIDVGVLSMRQRRTPPAWLGRVLAVSMSVNVSGLPIGSAIGGIVVTISVPLAHAVAAVASVLAAAAAWWLIPDSGEPDSDGSPDRFAR